MQHVTVIGAGTMGHGIAQVAAMAGFTTTITDSRGAALVEVRARIEANLAGAVSRGKLTQAAADATLERISIVSEPASAVKEADLVIEAIHEDLGAKREL